jgi:hypothetical protein
MIIWMAVDGKPSTAGCIKKALRLTDFIDQRQDTLNINGNISEIGIFWKLLYFIKFNIT